MPFRAYLHTGSNYSYISHGLVTNPLKVDDYLMRFSGKYAAERTQTTGESRPQRLQHASPLSKLEPAPEKSEIYGVRIPNPWILSELTRSVIIANPTGPVHVPNHYRTHFPEDDTLIAPNIYVLISYIYGGFLLSHIVRRDVGLIDPHGTHYAGSLLLP
ncbi:hypothetical protein PIB30_084470 [Stylosanthes scabra]|uniref:Uncharacterized protein n=1 Tax=Stylosanthes scabra TaxID=79078 RepID=A0ABU6YRH0_9FABA|nr:hypothetical protein [Stylosanthes scabra]